MSRRRLRLLGRILDLLWSALGVALLAVCVGAIGMHLVEMVRAQPWPITCAGALFASLCALMLALLRVTIQRNVEIGALEMRVRLLQDMLALWNARPPGAPLEPEAQAECAQVRTFPPGGR